jgi:predicted Zn-ribbon and HTH transcriptional regulator
MKSSTIEKTVNELLELLPSKMKAILVARFGLDGEKPKTLEAIGKTLGVTRERVRQIEVASFKKLKKTKKSEEALKTLEGLEATLEKQGRFLGVKGFEQSTFKGKMSLLQENQLKVVLNSHQKFYYKKGNGKFSGLWYFKSTEKSAEIVGNVYESVLNYFKDNEKLIELDKLMKVILTDDFCTANEKSLLFDDEYAKNRLETILRNGKLTGVNLLNQWGLKAWKLIRPKGVRERAYLVFQKHQKPLHFREITELINNHFDLKKPAIPETVCNAIIHFDEFIAVEYGIYALVEWKLFDEEIKNEIVEFLGRAAEDNTSKQGAFVKLDRIAAHITEKQNKSIKTFVIQANLFDKELFSRRGDAYMLKLDNR